MYITNTTQSQDIMGSAFEFPLLSFLVTRVNTKCF